MEIPESEAGVAGPGATPKFAPVAESAGKYEDSMWQE
jgi:hypothetical protein